MCFIISCLKNNNNKIFFIDDLRGRGISQLIFFQIFFCKLFSYTLKQKYKQIHMMFMAFFLCRLFSPFFSPPQPLISISSIELNVANQTSPMSVICLEADQDYLHTNTQFLSGSYFWTYKLESNSLAKQLTSNKSLLS